MTHSYNYNRIKTMHCHPHIEQNEDVHSGILYASLHTGHIGKLVKMLHTPSHTRHKSCSTFTHTHTIYPHTNTTQNYIYLHIHTRYKNLFHSHTHTQLLCIYKMKMFILIRQHIMHIVETQIITMLCLPPIYWTK